MTVPNILGTIEGMVRTIVKKPSFKSASGTRQSGAVVSGGELTFEATEKEN